MPTKPAIVWYRYDLRLQDNSALQAAIATGVPVWPIYILDDELGGKWSHGAASRSYLHHALEDLSTQLAAVGLTLTLLKGNTVEILGRLAGQAEGIYYNHAYEPHERALEQKLPPNAYGYLSTMIWEPSAIKPYQVFTPYYRALLNNPWPVPVTVDLGHAKAGNPIEKGVSLEALELKPKIAWDKDFYTDIKPTRAWAVERLEKMRQSEAKYKEGRDIPSEDNTSKISAHLHYGQIGPREIAAACKRDGAYVRQLVWREFSTHTLLHNPHTVDKPLRAQFEKFPWVANENYIQAWKKGLTGYPLVDAGMRQLWKTGWMHNRVRMTTASFLVKHLLQPWQVGAEHYWDTLIDADLANNTFGWQWTAGCGADAAPYFRVFNPTLQQLKFDPQEKYIRQWVPEYGTIAYPQPIVEHTWARDRALAAFESIKMPVQ